MDQTQTVTLGGRAVQIIIDGPVRHDRYVRALARKAGVAAMQPKPGESIDAFVDRVLDGIIAADLDIPMIAALLAPAELPLRDWRPAVAAEMEGFLDTLTATEDKLAVRGLVAQAVVGFFANGFASLMTFPTSSGEPTAEPSTSASPPLASVGV